MEFIWLLFFLAWTWPLIQAWQVGQARLRLLARLQQKRGARIITLIHREESRSLLGLFTRRYIDIEDSEQVLRAIRNTPPDMPIDIILHTPGGLVLAAEQIAQALRKHPARTAAFIPHYAMSGGTLIALAVDELWMDENAVVGPIDPQVGGYPAGSILRAVALKGRNNVSDKTLILADVAEKAIRQVQDTVTRLLMHRFDEEKARGIARLLTEGHWTHDYPIDCEELRSLGIEVRCDLPKEIYRLMDYYPQAPDRRPSVTYSPIPATGDSGSRQRDEWI